MRIASRSHTHIQKTESATWVVDHALQAKPAVSVMVNYDGKLQTILPMRVEFPNDSQVIIRFSRPFSGQARLV